MRPRPLPLVAGALAVAVAFGAGCASFGSDPQSATDEHGDAGAPDGALADTGGPPDGAPADALPPKRFCDTRSPAPLICDDFDDVYGGPPLEQRWSTAQQRGTFVLTNATATSRPQSLLLTVPIPAGEDNCNADFVSLSRAVDTQVASLTFGGSFWLDLPLGFAVNGGIQIQLDEDADDRCTMYMHWTKGGVVQIVADETVGGTSTSDAERVALTSVAVAQQRWVRIDVSVTASKEGASVAANVDGTPSPNAGTFKNCRGTRLTAFKLKVNCYDLAAPADFHLGVDDVTLELQ